MLSFKEVYITRNNFCYPYIGNPSQTMSAYKFKYKNKLENILNKWNTTNNDKDNKKEMLFDKDSFIKYLNYNKDQYSLRQPDLISSALDLIPNFFIENHQNDLWMLPEINMENKELITYFDTEENLKYWKWKTIRLGGFLQQHFSHIYNHNEITKLCEKTYAEFTNNNTIQKVQSQEELESIIRNGGFFSCIHFPTWPKDKPHPGLVYWSPNIETYYISKNGKTQARAFCYNKNFYLRGNSPQTNILEKYLREQKYTPKSYNDPSFYGIIYNKLIDPTNGKIICCHTDPCEYVIDMGDHFLGTGHQNNPKPTHYFGGVEGYARAL